MTEVAIAEPRVGGATSAQPSRAARGSAPRRVRVAIAGCGVVGSELLRVLAGSADRIEREWAIRFEVTRVLVRRPALERAAPIRPGMITADLASFLEVDADIVVEAIGDPETAARIARATLRRGKRLVTANKALLAERGDELAGLASRGRGTLDFEAAVGSAVPVVRVLRGSLAGSPVQRIRAILNGTCNYVLSRLEAGQSLGQAVCEAQAKGFAEADPSRDLDGRDAAEKIAVLAWLAFGLPPRQAIVRRRGILPDPSILSRSAAALGGRLRLIGECRRTEAGVVSHVEPVIIGHDSRFAGPADEENLVLLESAALGTLQLSGPGAGGRPTANALLGDMLAPAHPLSDGRSSPGAAVDRDAHDWLVCARGPGAHTLASLHATGPATGRDELDRLDGWERRTFEDCSWPDLMVALRPLEEAGATLAIGRLALAGENP